MTFAGLDRSVTDPAPRQQDGPRAPPSRPGSCTPKRPGRCGRTDAPASAAEASPLRPGPPILTSPAPPQPLARGQLALPGTAIQPELRSSAGLRSDCRPAHRCTPPGSRLARWRRPEQPQAVQRARGVVRHKGPAVLAECAPVAAEEDVTAGLAIQHLQNTRAAVARRRRPVEQAPNRYVGLGPVRCDRSLERNDFKSPQICHCAVKQPRNRRSMPPWVASPALLANETAVERSDVRLQT